MALATLPPAVEIVEAFKSGAQGNTTSSVRRNLSEPYWAVSGPAEQPPWKIAAFWKLSTLRESGSSVAGLGDFRVSDRALTELRKFVNGIQAQSLPLPTIAPVSGGAVFASWKNGARSVEVTAYDDGEILVEGLDNQNLNDAVSKQEITSIFDWLVES